MAGPIQLYFDVWPAATPASGSALGELTQARDKKIQKVVSDVGLGQFTINRHDSQAAWCATGNLVRVRLVGGGPFAWNSSNYKFAFYIEDLTDEIVSPDEEAGDDWTRGGRGILSVLERLVWWSDTFVANGSVPRTDGKWHWTNDQFGDIFHRSILEWNARTAPKPIPATLTIDFSSTVDSDGTSWPSFSGSHEIDVTQDYLASAFDLCSQGLEIGMKPDYTTQAWVQGGKGSNKAATVAFRHGWNIRQAGSRVGFGPKRATRALVRGSNNTFVEVTDALTAGDEAGKWGRREVGIAYQKSADTAPLTRAGEQALRSLRIAEDGPPQFGVTSYGSGTDGGSPPAKQDFLPFTDYDEGDTVTFDVPGEYANVAKRIHAITIEDGENGEAEVTLTLDGAPFDGAGGASSPTEAPGGGAAGCDCPPNPNFAPPCLPDTPGTSLATWDFEQGNKFDTTQTINSGLQWEPAGTGKCPNGTACAYNTASHRQSGAIAVTGGASYTVAGSIRWIYDPTYRGGITVHWYNGSVGVGHSIIIDGAGHAKETTYPFSATIVAPATATTARIGHSAFAGGFVDNLSFSTAGTAADNDPNCTEVPGTSPYAARSDEVGNTTTVVATDTGVPMLNSSGGDLTRGTVVVVDPTNPLAFTTSTSAAQTPRTVGVLLEDIDDDAIGLVAFEGLVEEIRVSGSPAVGDHLAVASVAGEAQSSTARAVGTFGEVVAREVVTEPTLVGFGTTDDDPTSVVVPGLPTGWAEGDIFLLFHVSADPGTPPSGYAQVTNSPQNPTGAGMELGVYWKRATASESAPTVAAAGNAMAVIAAFRGCPPTGNPWNITSGGTEVTIDTSVEIPGATTTLPNCYVVVVASRDGDTAAAQYSAWTNTDLDALTEIYDGGFSQGNGGGLGVAAGIKSEIGAYGTTTATVALSTRDGMMTIALEAVPVADATVVALLWGQTDPPAVAVSETTDGNVQAALDVLRARVSSWKDAVRAATVSAGTLATSFENGDTIDGVTLATGDRILLKDQAAGAENGIYVVAASGAPARATDMNVSSEVLQATVQSSEGTLNADKIFRCTTNAPITLGTTALVFTELSAGGSALTVEEADGSPTVTAVDKIIYDGLVVTDLGSGDVKISLPAAASAKASATSDYTPTTTTATDVTGATLSLAAGTYIVVGTFDVSRNGGTNDRTFEGVLDVGGTDENDLATWTPLGSVVVRGQVLQVWRVVLASTTTVKLQARHSGGSAGDYTVNAANTTLTAWVPAGGSLGAWTAYTPSFTATTTNPTLGGSTLVGRYKLLDANTLAFRINLDITTGGAWNAGSGSWQFGLPSGMTSVAARQVVVGHLRDSGTTHYVLSGRISASDTKIDEIYVADGSNPRLLTAVAPITPATGDQIELQGIIELA